MEPNNQSENKLEARDFDEVLRLIKQSSESRSMISDAFFAFVIVFLAIAIASFLILSTLEAWRLGYSMVFPVVGAVFALVCLVFAHKQFTASHDKEKYKDRIFFLKCMRAAQSVDELDQLGFFRVPPSRTGEDYKKDRDNMAKKMVKTFSSRSIR